MLSQDIVDSLFPPDLPEADHWEHRYPPRELPEGAKVTRIAPSPTGFLTIGGVFTAMIDADVARQSGGVYLVRLEDTDQARFTEGAAEQFAEAFEYFSIGEPACCRHSSATTLFGVRVIPGCSAVIPDES